jgi:hypothetical protein
LYRRPIDAFQFEDDSIEPKISLHDSFARFFFLIMLRFMLGSEGNSTHVTG